MSPWDAVLMTVFVVANMLIAWCYMWVLGRRAWELGRHLWGTFVTICGTGHAVMAIYMAFYPESIWLWVSVVMIDSITAIVSFETVYREPEPP